MKKIDNFDVTKWLVENKITTQSRLNEDMAKEKMYEVTVTHKITKESSHVWVIATSEEEARKNVENSGMKMEDYYISSVAELYSEDLDESRLNEEEYSSERINQRDVEIAGGEVINHTFDTVDMIDLDNGYKVKITTTYYFRDPGVKGYTSTASDENPMLSGVKTTLMDPSGKPIKNHNFTGSGQWWMLQGGKEYFMPQIKAWWENKMGKLGLSESRLNEEAKDPDSAVSQEARNMFYNAVSKVMEDLRKAGIVDDDVIDSYLGTEGGLLGDAIEASLHPEDLDESKLNKDLTDEIAALPNHHTAEDTAEATLVVGKYAVVRYDESDEGGEDMYVVWDNTVNQDEIGSYDDEPEFESTDPAEVAAFLKKNS